MPWVPTTDFEEEVVNLQPHHDFIYGILSEPEYNYPRPKAHTEYAANKKSESRGQNASKINGKLHVIQQVQRIAKTKPIGEQPSIDDWDDNKKIEQETIAMMRHYGMGVSVEQPLNQEVTIATYPVENTIKMVKSGRKKVALYFDDNVFKLKEKVTDTSSGIDSCNKSDLYRIQNNGNNILNPEMEGDDVSTEACCNTSFASCSSLSMKSFSTTEDNNGSFSSEAASLTATPIRLKAQRLRQYEKLIEDTALLSLNSSYNSTEQNIDSFKTAEETSFWRPKSEDEENVLEKPENWPVLEKQTGSTNKKFKNKSNLNTSCNKDTSFNNNFHVDLNDKSSDINSSSSSKNENNSKTSNFLDRFIKTDNCDTLNTTTETSASETSSQEPTTYATIAKAPKNPSKSTSPRKGKVNSQSNVITDFQPFYTTRRMYALKRSTK